MNVGDIVHRNKLLKTELLRTRKEFEQIFANSKVINSPTLTLRYTKGTCRKIGFLISKHEIKKAVARNHIKRYLREIYQHHKNYFPDNYFYIIQAHKFAQTKNLKELESEVLDLLEKANNG